MENKSILSLKTRVSELEKQHNRLTTLVVSVMANCEKLKKRLLESEGNAVSSSVDKNIQNILNNESADNDQRTEQISNLVDISLHNYRYSFFKIFDIVPSLISTPFCCDI